MYGSYIVTWTIAIGDKLDTHVIIRYQFPGPGFVIVLYNVLQCAAGLPFC